MLVGWVLLAMTSGVEKSRNKLLNLIGTGIYLSRSVPEVSGLAVRKRVERLTTQEFDTLP